METEKNYILSEAPLKKSIIKLVTPAVIGQIILVIYNIADTFFISLTRDDAKITAITVCMPAFMFISAISNLFGIGGCSVISRALGKQNNKRATNTSSFSFWSCLITTFIYIINIVIFMDNFINLLGGTNSNVHNYSVEYLTITVIIGGIFTSISGLISHLIRSEGHGFESGFGIALGGIANIVLDPIFMFIIFKPGYEIIGAAVATTIANVISVIYFIFIYIKNRCTTVLSFSPKNFKISEGIATSVLVAGLPAATMTLFENISYAFLDKIISRYGLAMQTGIGIAKKINMLAHSIVRGISQGMMPLISYNYACGNKKRMSSAVSASSFTAVSCAVLCMIISLVFSHSLVRIFLSGETDSAIYAIKFLRILCLGAPFSAFAYTTISFFQAIGEGKQSFFLAILRKGVVDIPLMYVFNFYSPFVASFATPITDAICCFMGAILLSYTMGYIFDNSKAICKYKHHTV